MYADEKSSPAVQEQKLLLIATTHPQVESGVELPGRCSSVETLLATSRLPQEGVILRTLGSEGSRVQYREHRKDVTSYVSTDAREGEESLVLEMQRSFAALPRCARSRDAQDDISSE